MAELLQALITELEAGRQPDAATVEKSGVRRFLDGAEQLATVVTAIQGIDLGGAIELFHRFFR
ncbi:hypothetical protein D3C85_1947830 [compost metagenome]